MRTIAIIPARSGSKGLKNKNIKLLNGKPLIAYTIEAAIVSQIFDEIFVSTDSEEYAKIAQNYGAKAPFLRSAYLSSDTASSWDTVNETLIKYFENGHFFNTCFLLQPTSPLRDKHDIINAYNLFIEKSASAVVSVCEVDHPIQWCFPLGSDCLMSEFAKSEYRKLRRQDVTKTYRENGAIYIVDANKIMNSDYDIYKKDCYAFIMDKRKSLDIDDQLDFEIAECLIKGEI